MVLFFVGFINWIVLFVVDLVFCYIINVVFVFKLGCGVVVESVTFLYFFFMGDRIDVLRGLGILVFIDCKKMNYMLKLGLIFRYFIVV